jgi:hypothetical protein
MADALFGESIMKIMEIQFTNLRDGDRYYYEIDEGLSEEEIQEIKATKLSDIIRRNTDITLMQDDVFRAMDHEDIPFANVTVIKRQLDIAVFPNPVVDVANFKVYSFDAGQADIVIHDPAGRQIYAQTMEFVEGVNKFSVPFNPNISNGIYLTQVRINDDYNTVKLLKL